MLQAPNRARASSVSTGEVIYDRFVGQAVMHRIDMGASRMELDYIMNATLRKPYRWLNSRGRAGSLMLTADNQ